MSACQGFPPELLTFLGEQPPLKTSPPGYPKTHPQTELPRWKGAAVIKEYAKADWMSTPRAIDRVRAIWRGAEPLKEWMETHVGMSEEPPARRGTPR